MGLLVVTALYEEQSLQHSVLYQLCEVDAVELRLREQVLSFLELAQLQQRLRKVQMRCLVLLIMLQHNAGYSKPNALT